MSHCSAGILKWRRWNYPGPAGWQRGNYQLWVFSSPWWGRRREGEDRQRADPHLNTFTKCEPISGPGAWRSPGLVTSVTVGSGAPERRREIFVIIWFIFYCFQWQKWYYLNMCPSEAITFGGTWSPFALIGDVNFDHLGKMAYQFYMYIHVHTYILCNESQIYMGRHLHIHALHMLCVCVWIDR